MSSEAVNQQTIRLEAARQGLLMFRNNNGACTDQTGRLIRYGLGNDSAQLNARIKSSDLIGITPILIGPQHIGAVLGVFTALECKKSGWHLTDGDERGQAQLRFMNLVREVGGYAGFCQTTDDLFKVIRR